eukprot:5477964-Amphidinium_carterae.1
MSSSAIAHSHNLRRVPLHVDLNESFEHTPATITTALGKIRSARPISSTYLRTSTCRPALRGVLTRKACSKSTASPQPQGKPHVHRLTNSASLNKDATLTAVHVERNVQGIEREATLSANCSSLSIGANS